MPLTLVSLAALCVALAWVSIYTRRMNSLLSRKLQTVAVERDTLRAAEETRVIRADEGKVLGVIDRFQDDTVVVKVNRSRFGGFESQWVNRTVFIQRAVAEPGLQPNPRSE